MFKNKALDGKLNLCGSNIRLLRKERKMSQRALADELQRKGIDLSKNAIQEIEAGSRFVTDIELKVLALILDESMEKLTQ